MRLMDPNHGRKEGSMRLMDLTSGCTSGWCIWRYPSGCTSG